MIVDISSDGTPALLEPARLDKLKVVVHASPVAFDSLREKLAPSIELLDRESAVIASSLIVELSKLGDDESWTKSWNATVRWALDRGWATDGGTRIRAHVEWLHEERHGATSATPPAPSAGTSRREQAVRACSTPSKSGTS